MKTLDPWRSPGEEAPGAKTLAILQERRAELPTQVGPRLVPLSPGRGLGDVTAANGPVAFLSS